MKDFKAWCIEFCLIMIITAVIRFLIPECKLKKTADTMLALIIVLTLVSPFANNSNLKSFDFDFNKTGEIVSDGENIQYDSAIESYVENLMHSNGVDIDYVKAKTDIDSEGYIIVKSINIKLTDYSQKETALKILEEESEIDCERVSIE